MAATAAYNATLTVATHTVNNIQSYDLPFKRDMVDTTSFSQATPGTHTYLPTLYGVAIKCSGNWDKGDTQGQVAIETSFFNATKLAYVFSPDGTHTYSCSCWVSDYNPKAEVKDRVTIDFTLTMDGGVTLA